MGETVDVLVVGKSSAWSIPHPMFNMFPQPEIMGRVHVQEEFLLSSALYRTTDELTVTMRSGRITATLRLTFH